VVPEWRVRRAVACLTPVVAVEGDTSSTVVAWAGGVVVVVVEVAVVEVVEVEVVVLEVEVVVGVVVTGVLVAGASAE
jgi:hypothetical protein